MTASTLLNLITQMTSRPYNLCYNIESYYTLTLSANKPLTLVDFAVFLPVVTEYAAGYDPKCRQCYIAVIYQAMYAEYPDNVVMHFVVI
jgi:hypothetical protein